MEVAYPHCPVSPLSGPVTHLSVLEVGRGSIHHLLHFLKQSQTDGVFLRGKEITSVPAHRILASYHLRVSARSRKKERKTRAKEEKSTTSRSAWLVSSENVMPCVNLKLWKSYPFSTLPRSRGEVGTY